MDINVALGFLKMPPRSIWIPPVPPGKEELSELNYFILRLKIDLLCLVSIATKMKSLFAILKGSSRFLFTSKSSSISSAIAMFMSFFFLLLLLMCSPDSAEIPLRFHALIKAITVARRGLAVTTARGFGSWASGLRSNNRIRRRRERYRRRRLCLLIFNVLSGVMHFTRSVTYHC